MGLLSGLGKLAGGLFGASQADPIPGFDFDVDIKTPSFRLKAGQTGSLDLTRIGSPQRFTSELFNLAEVRGEVRPGFGRFTEAAVESIRRAKGDALGTARDQLARRRILGSSFGAAQLASIEDRFGRAEAEKRAEALLNELNATVGIIEREFKVKTQNFKFELEELRIATSLTQTFMGVLSDQARIDKDIAVLAAQGEADFFSTLGGVAGSFLGTAIGGPIGGAIGGKLGAAIGGAL